MAVSLLDCKGDAEIQRRLLNLSLEESFDLSKVIECPVCFDVCADPSFVCDRGHLLCGECYSNGVSICPICQSSMLMPSKNLSTFIEQCQSVSCAYRMFGCEMNISGLSSKSHEIDCPFRRIKCPASMCLDMINEGDLKNHVFSKHKTDCSDVASFVSVRIDKSDIATIFFRGYSKGLISFQMQHCDRKVIAKATFVETQVIPENVLLKIVFKKKMTEMSWEGKVLSADSGDDENVFQCNVQKLQQFATDFGTNEQKIEAYVNLVGNTSGNCQHYKRGCLLICPEANCNIFTPCHVCHDEKIKGHSFNRFEVRDVQCTMCGIKQSPKKNCGNCNNLFGKYFCQICNLYDKDNDESVIFHCAKCGICRKRASPSAAYTHCDKCGICIQSSINHKCQTLSATGDCFVCKKTKFHSMTLLRLLMCGHYVHEECFQFKLSNDLECGDCCKAD